MDRQSLKQAAQRALQRFRARSEDELRAIMDNPAYRGLFHEISEMTLSESDADTSKGIGEELDLRSTQDEPSFVGYFPLRISNITWSSPALGYTPSEGVDDIFSHIRDSRENGQEYISLPQVSLVKMPGVAFPTILTIPAIDRAANETSALYFDKDENEWYLNARAA